MTNRMILFCEEYLVDFNATQAAIRAGYSKKTAYSQGQRLLKNVEIQAYIKKRKAELLETIKEDQLGTLRQLQKLVHFDSRKLYDERGNFKPIPDLDDETACAVSGVDISHAKIEYRGEKKITEHTIKVKTCDKIAAIRLMMQFQGAIGPDVVNNNTFIGVRLPEEIEDVPA